MDRSVRQSMDPVRRGVPWTGGQCFRVTQFIKRVKGVAKAGADVFRSLRGILSTPVALDPFRSNSRSTYLAVTGWKLKKNS